MVNLVTSAKNVPIDRNGVKIEVNSEVLFKIAGRIVEGKVFGYTSDMKFAYILSASYNPNNVNSIKAFKRLGKNIVVVKDLSNWKNFSSSWY